MKRAVLACLVAGCGDLVGFAGDVPPLATIEVATSGDFESVREPGATSEDLRVALVWGTQWLTEPMCILPADSPEVATVVAEGCRDPLAFTPERVTTSVALGEPLDLYELPSADLMFGDVTARVAYASLVVFDDRDHDGTLELARPRRLPGAEFDGGGGDMDPPSNDLIYGSSFVEMTQPDTRLAFREGDFFETGFYPRHGCGEPLPAFSLLSAGGFSLEAAIAATAAGVLPSEEPASCAQSDLAAPITIPFRPTPEVREVGCEQRRKDSSVRYRQPPVDRPALDTHAFACTTIPSFGGADPDTAGIIQLVAASSLDESCNGLTHYTLIGCDEGVLVCDTPEWDLRANPPAWWPCPAEAP